MFETAIILAVPSMFMLGVSNLFEWGRIAIAFWIVIATMALGAPLLYLFGPWAKSAVFLMFVPAAQLLWYHLLRIAMYGSWSAKPKFALGDPRYSAGSMLDRSFGVVFVLSSVFLTTFLL
jgi:hypothetical protein